jgi:hypothetical protein
MRVSLAAACALAATLVHGCACEDDLRALADEPPAAVDDPAPAASVGAIAGCACDEAAGRWVAGANVFVVVDDVVFATGTAVDGCFVLEGVPAGDRVLVVEKAPFRAEHAVAVVADAVVEIPTPAVCAPPPVAGTGVVEGRVCAPDGTTWLSGADVSVEPAGADPVATTTDVDGRFRLEGVPAGAQTLHVRKGSFASTRAIVVPVDGTLAIPEDECELDDALAIAVVTGRNDDVGTILEQIGVDAASITTYGGTGTGWGAELLEDWETLSQYDIVFVNCGANGIDDYFFLGLFTTVVDSPTAIENLRRFVDEGGSVYASDEAYDLIERAWPDFVDFHGDDAAIDAAQIGSQESDPVPVDIVDANLAAAMGASVFDIHFNYTLWAIIADVRGRAGRRAAHRRLLARPGSRALHVVPPGARRRQRDAAAPAPADVRALTRAW